MTTYTAADVARFCEVDLKTIHNWVGKNVLVHHRTPGRHLRFHRLDVIEFLRAYGYPVAEELRAVRPRVLLAYRESPQAAALKRALARKLEVIAYEDAFDALVSMVTAAPEALVLDVSLLGSATARCIARLRTNDATRHIRVVAIGEAEERALLVGAGASACVPPGELGEVREAVERTAEVA